MTTVIDTQQLQLLQEFERRRRVSKRGYLFSLPTVVGSVGKGYCSAH